MQQINLLNALPQQHNTWLSAKMIFWLSLGLVSVLMVYFCQIELRRLYIISELSQLTTQKSIASETFHETVKKHPLMVDTKSLHAKVEALEAQVIARDNSWKKFTRSALSQGFAEYMQGLAQYVPAGVWLDSIYINNHDATIVLEGHSLKPAMIPLAMNNLSKSDLFKNKVFKVLQLLANKKDATVTFWIGTSSIPTAGLATNNPNTTGGNPTTMNTSRQMADSLQEKL